MIEIADGTVRTVRGRPDPRFVAACSDIARLYGLRSGRIECTGRGAAARLRFSRDIPERVRQPIRNVWTPPPTPPRPGRRARR